MEAMTGIRIDVTAAGVGVFCAVVATIVGIACVVVNLERTCALHESPAAAFCNPPAAGSPAEIEMLRARIARDPGDSNAYTALALADAAGTHGPVVAAASSLAPREPNLLLRRAAAAFERKNWAEAVPPLIELAEGHQVPEAANSLAYLVATGQQALLEPYLQPGSRWLPPVLLAMRTRGSSFSGVLPLVVQGLQRGVLDLDSVRAYVRDLKAASAWGDAFALWLSLHGGSQPALFNGSFEQEFEPDGFDWEVPTAGPARRAGTIVGRRRAEEHGYVLDVQFTGRAIAVPIVRQYLFIARGPYRIRGEYYSRQFRAEDGMVWRIRCGNSVIATSAPLGDNSGLWRPFELEFRIPDSCGLVAALQLEPASAAGAALGARGRMSFDALNLEKAGR
jgi:hypothetical protein